MAVHTKPDFLASIHELGAVELIGSISGDEALELSEKYGTENYHPLPVNAVRTEGARVWDADGREYIDCIGAYSAVSHGHLNPTVVKAIHDQLKKQALVSRALSCPELGVFLRALCEYTGLDRACPMNSGAEAVETCIKLARKWAYEVKNVPNGMAEIIVAEGNFHGRTTTIVGFSSEEGYRRHFGPFTPGFRLIPFGDIEALKRAITPNTATVLMEPIQAEGGVIVPPDGFLAEARQVCTQQDVLLIWDEIQTGFCRTGKRFAWQWEDAQPDLMSVGKALGGGVYPVSAAVGREHVMSMFRPGDHGSTFGGNPLACAVGLAAIGELVHGAMEDRAQQLGQRLHKGLESAGPGKIKEVRGKGLLIGLEVQPDVDSERLTSAFLEAGLLTKETRQSTFRFAPPLTADDALIDDAIERAHKALSKV